MVAVALYYLLSEGSVGRYREVEVLIAEAEVEAHSEVGYAVANVNLVALVDYAVVVHVNILHVARLHVGLLYAVACCYPVLYFLLVLEYAGSLVTPEVANGVAVLCAEELVGVVVELAGVAVDYAVLGRYVTYFVVVPCTVYTYIILEVLADVVVL